MLLRRYNSSRVLVQRCEYSLFHRTFHRTFQRMFHRKGVGSSPIFGHDPNVLGEYLAVYESTRHWGAGIRLPRTQCDDVLEHSEVAVPLLDVAALHTRMHARTHACTYTHTHTCTRTRTRARAHAHAHANTHMCKCRRKRTGRQPAGGAGSGSTDRPARKDGWVGAAGGRARIYTHMCTHTQT